MKTLRRLLAAAVVATFMFAGITLGGPALNPDDGATAQSPIKGGEYWYIEGDFPGTCGESCSFDDGGDCDCWTDDG